MTIDGPLLDPILAGGETSYMSLDHLPSSASPTPSSSSPTVLTHSTAPFDNLADATTNALTTYTSIITYKGRSIKARIDSNVPTHEIINQLCHSNQLGISEPAAVFCLRDYDSDQLVTDDNLGKALQAGRRFKLASSPIIDAAEAVEKMGTREEKTVKLAVFELKKYIHEPVFVKAFCDRGGLVELAACIQSASGNTLAYALTAMQYLMETGSSKLGWNAAVDLAFIVRIIHIFCQQSLVNILRPATAILRVLVERDPEFGFLTVWPLMHQESEFLPMLVSRLRAADQLLVTQVVQLVVSLCKAAYRYQMWTLWEECERLLVRLTIFETTQHGAMNDNDLSRAIFDFYSQAVVPMASTYLALPVDFESVEHAALVDHMCTSLRLSKEDGMEHLGLHEQPMSALSLQMLVTSATLVSPDLTNFISDQSRRSKQDRCPIALASNVILSFLATQFGFRDADNPDAQRFQPFGLVYDRVHAYMLQLFCKLWIDAGSVRSDAEVERIASLTALQMNAILNTNGPHTLESFQQQMKKGTYRELRDQQTQDMAIEETLLVKGPIRNLRSQLYNESFEIVRAQRLACLKKGQWFPLSSSSTPSLLSGSGHSKRTSLPTTGAWRFYRLSANHKQICYVEAQQKPSNWSALDYAELPHSIPVDHIADIQPHRTPRQSLKSAGQPSTVQPGFTIKLSNGTLIDFTVKDQDVYAEWIDGLSLLRPNGTIHTKETADLVQALCDTGVKVRLLDLTGEKIPIATSVSVDCQPNNVAFHYANL